MRITFDAKPSGGLKVIGEIPDHPLVRLEGRNGVGKTVAVRLLELSTGSHPYASQVPAWMSLKQHLGQAHITIEGLRGGSTLRITLTPELWPDDPSAGATLGSATLDGSAIDFADIRQFLSVVRIGGDETITTQIRTRLAEDIALLDRKKSLIDPNIARLESLLDRVTGDVRGLTPEYLALLEEEEETASELRERAGAEYRRAAELIGKHEELGRLMSLLEALKEQTPSIDMAIAETDLRIQEVVAKRSELEERRRQLLPEAERQKRLLDKTTKLAKNRDRLVAEVKDIASKLSGATLDLALDADPRILRDAASSVTSELNNLRQHRVALSILPELSDLIRRIDDPIAGAAETGLSEEVIAVLPRARITVSQFHEGLTRRKGELGIQLGPQRSLIEEIEEQIRSLGQRLDAIRQAERYMEQLENASRRLGKAEESLRQALDAISVSGDEQYQEIVALMATIDRIISIGRG